MWRSSTNNKRALRVGAVSAAEGGGGCAGAGASSGYESSDNGSYGQHGALWDAWKVIEPVVQAAAQRYVASTLASIGVTR